MGKEDINISNIIKLGAALLTLSAPLAYIIGLAYYEGVLTTYGINSDLFPVSIQDIYVSAYLAIALLLTRPYYNLLGIFDSSTGLEWFAYIILGMVIIFYLIFKLSRLKPKVKEVGFNGSWVGVQNFCKFVDPAKNSLTASLLTIMILGFGTVLLISSLLVMHVSWVNPLKAGYLMGEMSASREIATYLEKGCFASSKDEWSNCRILKSATGEILYEGLLVAASTEYIAFFTKEGSVITQFPKGVVLVHQRATAPAENSN